MMKYKYSFLAGIVAGGVVVFLMIRAVNGFSAAMGPVGNERIFDEAVWKTDEGYTRYEMVDDLQIHYLRKGLKKSQVIKLLGKPDGSGHYTSEYSQTSRVITYNMGYVFLDPCTFDLEFSEDNKLIGYEINCN